MSFFHIDEGNRGPRSKHYAICNPCIDYILGSLSRKGQNGSSCVVTVVFVPAPLAESRKFVPLELLVLLSDLCENKPHLRPL